jgi:hypothetical protein
LQKHLKKPFTAKDFQGKIFSFKNKSGIRIYHPAPCRVFLVHNINGRWLYWGHAKIIEQTVNAESKMTSGKFIITKIYGPDYQRTISKNEVDAGKEFFKQ